MPPSRSLPPLEFCFGTRPIQAARSRPVLNTAGSATLATNALASSGPTPGMAISRRPTSVSRALSRMRRSFSSTCFFTTASWAASIARHTRLVIQASPPDQLGLRIVHALKDRDNRIKVATARNTPPRYNAAPSQELWVIRQNRDTGERSLDLLKWGLIPYWCKEKPKPPPINAKCETVVKLPMFRDAYAKRRCIMPIDGFFEWKAILGSKAKQPYAIAMKDRSPFGLAGLWENWKDPATGE